MFIPESYIGSMTNKTTKEIVSSKISIGCETLDRDFADYHNYKEYLSNLGAKRARVQTGWAKIEKEKGKYNFEWLDIIVDDMISRDVQPWLEFNYGNTIYEGGGGTTLRGGIPSSEEALAAWDNWVSAMVTRYKDKIFEWEVWNEPDLSEAVSPEDYANFFIRTSIITKKIQPNAKIIAFGLCTPHNFHYINTLLDALKEIDRLDLIDVVAVHGYPYNPDTHENIYRILKAIVKDYKEGIEIWQGETGCPSEPGSSGAMDGFLSSEVKQAKWLLRRCLNALGNDIIFNYFTFVDLDYMVRMNVKGILKATKGLEVIRPKKAFYSFRNLISIFDDTFKLDEIAKVSANVNYAFKSFVFKSNKGEYIVPIWNRSAEISGDNEFSPSLIFLENFKVNEPVIVDLFSGDIFRIDPEKITRFKDSMIIEDIPVYDSPIVIAEKSAINF